MQTRLLVVTGFYGWLRVVTVITGDSKEEVMIFHDTQTDTS